MRYLVLIAIAGIGINSAWAEPASYCDDPAAREEWRQVAIQYEEEDVIQLLHATWLGLCAKVKDGSLEVERAIRLFEDQRRRVRQEIKGRGKAQRWIDRLG